MALVGNLAECGPAQVMRLVMLGRKTGRLTLQGANRTAECYFRHGRLEAVRLPDAPPLLDALGEVGLLTPEQRASLRPYGAQSDKGLARLLAELGYVETPRLLATLRQHATESVQAITRWDRGTFRLDEGVDPPEDAIGLGLDLAGLVAAPTTNVIVGGIEAAPAPTPATAAPPKPKRWWDWLRGGRDDRRH